MYHLYISLFNASENKRISNHENAFSLRGRIERSTDNNAWQCFFFFFIVHLFLRRNNCIGVISYDYQHKNLVTTEFL